jgi:hypothetical protein
MHHARRVLGVRIIHSHGTAPTIMPTSATLCRRASAVAAPRLIRHRANAATTAAATGTSATVISTTWVRLS